jgi:hypothetical protein
MFPEQTKDLVKKIRDLSKIPNVSEVAQIVVFGQSFPITNYKIKDRYKWIKDTSTKCYPFYLGRRTYVDVGEGLRINGVYNKKGFEIFQTDHSRHIDTYNIASSLIDESTIKEPGIYEICSYTEDGWIKIELYSLGNLKLSKPCTTWHSSKENPKYNLKIASAWLYDDLRKPNDYRTGIPSGLMFIRENGERAKFCKTVLPWYLYSYIIKAKTKARLITNLKEREAIDNLAVKDYDALKQLKFLKDLHLRNGRELIARNLASRTNISRSQEPVESAN